MLITLDSECYYNRLQDIFPSREGVSTLYWVDLDPGQIPNLLEEELLVSYKETQNNSLVRQFNFAKGRTVTQTEEPSMAGQEVHFIFI